MDFNGGLVPILETPNGTMVNESGVISQFACDFKPDSYQLWPHEGNPGNVEATVATGRMRLNIQKFDNLFMGNFFPAYMMRFTDEAKNAAAA